MIFILNVGNEEEGPSADVKALLAWAKGKTYHKCRELDIIFHKSVTDPLDTAPPENAIVNRMPKRKIYHIFRIEISW